jgi:hypothetical protein
MASLEIIDDEPAAEVEVAEAEVVEQQTFGSTAEEAPSQDDMARLDGASRVAPRATRRLLPVHVGDTPPVTPQKGAVPGDEWAAGAELSKIVLLGNATVGKNALIDDEPAAEVEVAEVEAAEQQTLESAAEEAPSRLLSKAEK